MFLIMALSGYRLELVFHTKTQTTYTMEVPLMNSSFDFDKMVKRRGTASVKWDLRDDVIPMWVGDVVSDYHMVRTIVKEPGTVSMVTPLNRTVSLSSDGLG